MHFFWITPAYAQTTMTTSEGQSHIFQILWGADPVVKLTLLILLAFSVASWAIIVFKQKEIKKTRLNSLRFADLFWKTKNLDGLIGKHAASENPLANIFRVAVGEVLKKSRTEGESAPSIDGVKRKIERATEEEIEKIERYVPFLATTGSSTPFIGLFGTVWGILAAFWQIGRAGSSSLAVVGPFIAEALIATAFGLAAAIPAVIFYNLFVTRIRILTREMQNFSVDLADRITREYFTR